MNSEVLIPNRGEMAAAIQNFDWSRTPVGAMQTWPQSLKTAVQIMLGSRYPMFVWWGEAMTNFYNDPYIQVLGQRHPQALGQSATQVWAEIWDILGPQAEAVLNRGESSWNEALLLVMERNGYPEETYFTFSYSPVANDDGGVGGVFCACTEDTQKVIGDRRLRTLRELAAATSEARTAEIACEIAAHSLQSNPYDIPFALLYLLEPEAERAHLAGTTAIAPGIAASPVAIQPDLEIDHWSLQRVIETGATLVIDPLPPSLAALPGGAWAEFPHQAIVLPLTTPGQTRLAGFLIAGISPLRQLDEAYRGFFELLAGQITTAIANARAYEAERQRAESLAELDRAKTLFFSNISHEFRTPLTLMLAPTEDLLASLVNRQEPEALQQRERVELIHRNGLRLLKLVNTLLDFSRIEAGRVQTVYEPTDLAQYTADLASVFRSLIERAGMQLLVDCPPLPEPVYVDREMWEKIVLNLLSNAFKFTFAGTITVRLQHQQQSVQLAVEDTGIGIPAAELPHLFERFHRIRTTQGRSFEGSGIGLSLVQELVKLHGGLVEVSSREGQGSCFTVSLPLGREHLPAAQIATTPSLVSTATAAIAYLEEAQGWLPDSQHGWGQGATDEAFASLAERPKLALSEAKRILLVEDNTDMREYVKRLLAPSFLVEAVSNGEAALTAVQQQRPDLVLSDVMMPEMDGFQLLRSLRSDPQTADIPVILLSARAGEEARLEGLGAGADGYLIKPFSARELLARVESCLKLSQLRQEANRREQGLRAESEAAYSRISQILESMTDAFIALDRDWHITYMNAAAEQINGQPRSEVLGKTIWEEWPAAVGSISEREYRQAIAAQIPVHFEQHYYEPPDHDVWLEVHAYPFEEGLGVFYHDITEKKQLEADRQQAEINLQQSEARARARAKELETLMQVTPVGLWIAHDPKCHWMTANQTAYEMMRLAPGLVPTSTPADGSYPLPFRQLRNGVEIDPQDLPMQKAGRTGQSFTDEIEFVFGDGSSRTIYGQAIPLKDENDQIWGVVGAFVDISERKRIEANLQQSEQNFRTLADNISQFAWMGDGEGSLFWYNRRWFEYTGTTLEEMQGWGWRQVHHPEHLERVEQHFRHCLQTGEPWEDTFPLRGRDGHYRWFLSRAIPIRDEGGQIYRWFGTNTDIDALKRAEATIERGRERLQLLYETTQSLLSSQQPLELIDSLFQKLQVKIAVDVYCCYLLETDRQQLRLTAAAGVDPDRLQDLQWLNFGQQICGVVAERRSQMVRSNLLSSCEPLDQLPRSLGLNAYACQPLVAQGKLFGTLAFGSRARDRFTSAETELMQSLCDQIAIALDRAQLFKSLQTQTDELREANRIKDEFLAVLSHELRSPLNPILGWTKLLQTRPFDPQKSKEALATIERNAKVQTQLIDDLLDISRILRGKLALNPVPSGLKGIIAAALETVRLSAAAKAIEIEQHLPADDLYVLADGGRIQQIIWNLLSNAIKFTPNGGRVEVRLERQEGEGNREQGTGNREPSEKQDAVSAQPSALAPQPSAFASEPSAIYALITVTDTGKGISSDFIPYVFESFRQEDGKITRKFGGLGLGLAIVRHLVELHGGKVTATSDGEGKGARFTVWLPLIRDTSKVPIQTSPDSLTPAPLHPLSNLRILVVDDEADMRELASFILTEAGAVVKVVADPAQVLTLLEHFQPHLLLCDIGMPDVDGYTLLRQIRRGYTPEQLPAIALTAYARDEDCQQALAAGFQQHLSKPVEPAALVVAVAALARDRMSRLDQQIRLSGV